MRVLRISHSAVVDEWRHRERAIRSHGLRVHLLSARRWDEGGQVVPLEPRPGEDVRGVRTLGRHPNLFVYDPIALWRALGHRWDVVDVHEEPYSLATAEVLALLALRRRRPPVVLYSAQNIAKRFPPPFGWLERRALRRAAAVAVCNTQAGRIARSRGLRGPARLIGLGVDLARFSPAEDPGTGPGASGQDESSGATSAAGRERGDLRVGYVGRLAPHKGVDVLLEAAALDPGVRVEIAGAGPSEPALRLRAAQPDLAGRVRFTGHLAPEGLSSLYRRLDVVAVPSRPTPGWLEQFCRVAVEAMASGCVVVASDTGALPDVLDSAGILVLPGDPAALRAALDRVASDPGLARSLRSRGLARAQAFSWERVGAHYVELYAEITGRGGPARPDGPTPAAAAPEHDVTARDVPTSDAGLPPAGGPLPQVVVVAYGAPDLLARCLRALRGPAGTWAEAEGAHVWGGPPPDLDPHDVDHPSLGLPVLVVDNSGDPQVRAVTEAAGAEYLDPDANLGFAGAVNLALARRPRGADVLLLNPDAAISAAGVRELQRALHGEPGLAAVAPAQHDDSGAPAQVAWPFPSPARVWLQAMGLGRVAQRADFVIGSVLLLNGAALDDVGPFDDDFFLYSEETDWQFRARQAGWRAALVPSVVATHVGGGTSTDPLRREAHFHASQERYLRKHHGRRGWAAARGAVLVGAAARSAVLRGARGEEARRRGALYLRGPLRVEAAMLAGRSTTVGS
ncbi:glycosyltransferase [Cellulomonas chengniuliangii]|uniref:D-inositol 3-phosphate glycosyltransferase n=1 Tax=Cellulomonas chengniuliangii TaxID=2968084 RepID=A0ABY5L047_9CELL|nr:glycosyltransferase [Cellulomonas chengniuliangii]MCC2307133.1 glycosyltransferase [Cellulomonas chengniuliangii]MCC2316516.1 glycosyltransferase [Cellulomonas chengniuliangii]UUI76069.1 glycosyltransferase [Cellulomonas chengniuliangii]